MRQAGRYMPAYRKLRERHSILDLCHNPDLAAEVTLQPVERLGVDAAILFADILLPFEPLDLGLRFAAGEGPRIDRPIATAADVSRLPHIDPEHELRYVLDAARLARRALPADVPLIGFAGAPFTLVAISLPRRAPARRRCSSLTAGWDVSRHRITARTCSGIPSVRCHSRRKAGCR